MSDKPAKEEKRFTLTFSTENAAFDGHGYASEVMRILGVVRGQIATGRFSGPVVDANGNTIGSFLSTWRRE